MLVYDHILVRYGELALKGKNRTSFEKRLVQNIKGTLKEFTLLRLRRTFGRIVIELNGQDHIPVVDKLKHIFGIHSFSLAVRVENDLEQMKQAALQVIQTNEKPVRTFKIQARRAYKDYPIDSQKLNHHIGGYVLSQTESIRVDVHNPDIEVKVEVRESGTYITSGQFEGAGGLPVGSSGKVLLMLSGGIDSPVAGYMTLKRGAELEVIHFHSPPFTNERAKQKVIDLAKTLTKFGGNIKLHLVPFTEIQQQIHKNIPTNYEMTIMRRMMLRISEELAKKTKALAIASGESLGQVASQTLHSMHTINEVTNYPIIRPLVTMDKLEVIEWAKKIGTYEISILPYEDCCTIFLPAESKTKPKREHANKFEQYIEIEQFIQKAVDETEVLTIEGGSNSEQLVEELL
ncbi:tRNA uracil 4-sulfurtransferase ThiI [Halalkalibacterium ligniniphilum]|uniref:tRNA uracil 4-sulfurtransferase ThiI n=1 Tax=Halalkalibacterium ligniniphilum TaxID=1134413 RepID=UPI0003456818|nr:tRNA uracil 4-sulfurtransferase ThiI [Halalkalibacterium ligniniphilum]